MRALDAQSELLRRVGDKSMTRDDVAGAYANCIQATGFVNWPMVNHAIIRRWSESALVYIKDEAWKRLEPVGRSATSYSASNQDTERP